MVKCVLTETHTSPTQSCDCFRDESVLSGDREEHNNKGSFSKYRERKLMRLWPSSALSICQYTNRHPVHQLDFFIVSPPLLSTLKNEIVLCSACGYLIVCVSESLSRG